MHWHIQAEKLGWNVFSERYRGIVERLGAAQLNDDVMNFPPNTNGTNYVA